MAFWSSQTLTRRLPELVEPPNDALVDCNSVTLCVGSEIFVTPHIDDIYKQTKKLLSDKEPFQIPPGQFAFILTAETVNVPKNAMAFISMKATYKMQGLINVSGFHVDPGWIGPLIFAVFNAGPSPVHLERGLPLFLIWYADLDAESEKAKSTIGEKSIPPKLIGNLTSTMDSLYTLNQRLKEEVEKRRTEDDNLLKKMHEVEKSQVTIKITFGVVLGLLAGIFSFMFRDGLIPPRQSPNATVSSPGDAKR